VTQVKVHGPGSRADGNRVAETLTRGIDGGAKALAAISPEIGPAQIGRLKLRIPAGASEAEIARAFARALADHGAGGTRR
jgi:hypothetical protein